MRIWGPSILREGCSEKCRFVHEGFASRRKSEWVGRAIFGTHEKGRVANIRGTKRESESPIAWWRHNYRRREHLRREKGASERDTKNDLIAWNNLFPRNDLILRNDLIPEKILEYCDYFPIMSSHGSTWASGCIQLLVEFRPVFKKKWAQFHAVLAKLQFHSLLRENRSSSSRRSRRASRSGCIQLMVTAGRVHR